LIHFVSKSRVWVVRNDGKISRNVQLNHISRSLNIHLAVLASLLIIT